MNSTAIAHTILQQLGGGRFVTMTGAKALVAHPNALSFKLPGTPGFIKGGINYVRITLNGGDLYDIEFSKVRGLKVTIIEMKSDIYADQLQDIFTQVTGLQTSLGTMGIPAAAMRKFNNRHED